MSQIPRIVALTAAALLMFFSCSLPGSGNNGNSGTSDSRSLAEVVADDYIAQIQGTDYSRALVNNKLSSSDLSLIRATILARVNSDGLSKSKDIDKVLPSVMKGITAGADAFQASTGDSHVAAGLVSAGVKCSATSLSKHADQLSDSSVTLSSVITAVVKVGVDKIAVLAKDDPTSASTAIQAVVVQVSAELKPLAAKITATEVLKVVVTVTVDAAVQAKVTDLVQDAFSGTAQATTDATVVTGVVQEAVTKAKAADNSVDCLDLLKRAAAGLGSQATDKLIDDAAAAVATATSTTIDSTAIKAVAAETEPTATLTATIGGNAVSGDLDYQAAGYAVDLNFDGAATSGDTADFELTEQDGTVATATAKGKVTVNLTGSGTFLIQLKVKNHNGMKYHRVFVVIVIKAKADEKTPTASLVIKEGATEVTGALAWNKAGHTLTIDTSASSGDGNLIRTLTSTSDAVITESPAGVYTVVQKATPVTYTLFVRNAAGIKSASATKVVTIADEPAPTAVLSVATDKGAPVTGTLDYTGTPLSFGVSSLGSTADAAKTLTVVPAATVVDNGDGTWTVSGVTQTSVFTLKVTNNGGAKSTSISTTVTLAVPASQLVKDGLALLQQFKYDEARAKFASAILANASDNDAKVWYSYLELAGLAVNADVVAVMKTNLGAVDYPDNLNTLFSTSWMASKAYNMTSGVHEAFVSSQRELVRGNLVGLTTGYTYGWVNYYDASGNYNSQYATYFQPDASGTVYAQSWYRNGDSGGESNYAQTYLAANPSVKGYYKSYNMIDALNPSFFPTIAPVTGFVALDASHSTSGYTMTDWMRLAMTNAVMRNPSGFNALVDKVAAAGSFQTALQGAISRLQSVDANYRVTVPASLITAWFGSTPTIDVTIGKPELLVQAATLQVTTSFLQYLSSVNFSYPLTDAVATWMKSPYLENTDDGSVAGILKSAADSTPGIYHSTLLTNRSDTQRAASKATFLAALTSLSTAVDLYQTAVATDSSYYVATILPEFITLTNSGLDAVTLRSQVTNGLTNAKTALAKLSTAVSTGGSLIVPIGAVSTNPSVLLGDSFVWPTAEATDGSTMTIKPAAFWAENFLDIRSWLETDSSGFKPSLTGYYYLMVSLGGGSYASVSNTLTPMALPADRTQITPAALGLTGVTANDEPYGYLALSFKVKSSMYQKLVPNGVLPPNAYFTTASWRFVDTSYNSTTSTNVLNWHLTPPAGIEALLTWFNK